MLLWLLLAALTTAPYLRAQAAPPPGTSFLGFFFQIEDIFNYLTYVQQAEDGAFLFRSKLANGDEARLVNLEWWAVGRLSRLLGYRPALAFRIVGLLAGLALVLAADRWLRRCGLPQHQRIPALLLVLTGGGLGGLRYELLGPPAWRSLDLIAGFFPWFELLFNPHFLVGSALLSWCLLAFLEAKTKRDLALAVGLGTLLGLARPYDVVTVGGVRLIAIALGEPPRRWLARALPLAGLAPVVLFDAWLFYGGPAFQTFRMTGGFPPALDLAVALGPAAILASLALLPGLREPLGAARAHLLAWGLFALALLLLRPTAYTLQFLVGVGVPLLCLGALALGRAGTWAIWVGALASCTTFVVAMSIVLRPEPRWFAPAERLGVARALRSVCKPGELLFAPADVGLYAAGLTACHAYVSHGVAREFAEREREVLRFYDARTTPGERAALLDRLCVAHVVLPPAPGGRPESLLGPATPFGRTVVAAASGRALAAYSRAGPTDCPRTGARPR